MRVIERRFFQRRPVKGLSLVCRLNAGKSHTRVIFTAPSAQKKSPPSMRNVFNLRKPMFRVGADRCVRPPETHDFRRFLFKAVCFACSSIGDRRLRLSRSLRFWADTSVAPTRNGIFDHKPFVDDIAQHGEGAVAQPSIGNARALQRDGGRGLAVTVYFGSTKPIFFIAFCSVRFAMRDARAAPPAATSSRYALSLMMRSKRSFTGRSSSTTASATAALNSP